MRLLQAVVGVCAGAAVWLAGCTEAPRSPVVGLAVPQTDTLAKLGKAIFFDRTLSGSGKVSCASCHDPGHAYAPANGLAVQPSGTGDARAVFRAVPSLSYVLGRTPNWHQEHAAAFLEQLEDRDNPPFGGFGWDGRFATLGTQAAFPLLSREEMANDSAESLLRRLRATAYADQLREAFGAAVLERPDAALAAVGRALERFELTDGSFHPYSSKYDAVLDGKGTLTAQEARGLALFNDRERGNCSSCHTSSRGADGSHPLFTNFQFEALGVPRNGEIAANRDPRFYDLGLCGPLRRDQSGDAESCGMFKTPTLRNVATRGAFFHNGRFHTLREALHFYVERDTNPERFYPRGGTAIFDDLPTRYRGNVDRVDKPLTLHRGERPVWSDAEIEDVLAFLRTLTDGDRGR